VRGDLVSLWLTDFWVFGFSHRFLHPLSASRLSFAIAAGSSSWKPNQKPWLSQLPVVLLQLQLQQRGETELETMASWLKHLR
jgi:hypothetical protein